VLSATSVRVTWGVSRAGCGASVSRESAATRSGSAGQLVSGVPGALLVGWGWGFAGCGVAILMISGLVGTWVYQDPQQVVGEGKGWSWSWSCWRCGSSRGRWTLVRSGLHGTRAHQGRGFRRRYGTLCEVVVRDVGRDARDVVTETGGRDRDPSAGLPPERVRGGAGEKCFRGVAEADGAACRHATTANPRRGRRGRRWGMAARDHGNPRRGRRGRWCGLAARDRCQILAGVADPGVIVVRMGAERTARLSPFCAGAAAGQARLESRSCVSPGQRQAANILGAVPDMRDELGGW